MSDSSARVKRSIESTAPLRGLPKRFGDLKVRPKLMVLHNLFFLVLACAVYFSLISLFESSLRNARDREIRLVTQMFRTNLPPLDVPGLRIYQFQSGSATDLRVPMAAQEYLEHHPRGIWGEPSESGCYYLKTPDGYIRVRLPDSHYDEMLQRANWTLAIALGVVYVLAVLLLETTILPLYVYRPLRLMLDADEATRRGDRERELIGEGLIPDDEIGQIMRSRNTVIAELRRREDDLEEALKRLEQAAADLTRKNHLLETAKQNLADQDRLVSLGVLSASVAHEFNTPLSVLHGSIEKLMETAPPGVSQERLARMRRVTERMRRISGSLLDFARVRRQEMAPARLRPIIEEAWNLVAIDEKAGSVAFSNGVSEEVEVNGNADRLIQVFVNLLRNSLNAARENGMIRVSCRVCSEGGREWASVNVEDDGQGIPSDVLPHIFEAFITSRLDSRGTGLGLTVAEGIVHQHGGTIEAANRPEGGARLSVRLPASRREVNA